MEDDGVGRGEGSAKGTGLGTKLVNSMARTMEAEIQYLSGSREQLPVSCFRCPVKGRFPI